MILQGRKQNVQTNTYIYKNSFSLLGSISNNIALKLIIIPSSQ